MLYPGYPSEIESIYGFVRRARFCYLYTQSGKRLTDMYLEAGRAILGWRGLSSALAFKNVFARGVTGTFCSEEARRLKQAVKKLFGGAATVRWYADEKAAAFLELARQKEQGGDFCLWKPWALCETRHRGFLFLPPFPLAHNTVIFAAREDACAPPKMPASDIVPPCVLAGMTRSVYDLIAEIPRRPEKTWAAHDSALLAFWERRGAYLFPKIPRDSYGAFAAVCLQAGLVISPDYDIPSIVPWSADRGDVSALCSKVKSLYIA